jgi:MFS family permease
MEIDRNEMNAGGTISADRHSSIIKTLTANDVAFWGADGLISVVLALFIVSFIPGATVLNVGIALMINRTMSALAAIPLGRLFDKHRGHLDEVWGLALACFATGGIYLLLSFATAVWQLYVAMFFLGISYAVNLASWRILFYSNVRKREFGVEMGIYQTAYSFGVALFMAIGGFAGERFGYERVLMFGGLLMMCGSILPLLIRSYFSKR